MSKLPLDAKRSVLGDTESYDIPGLEGYHIYVSKVAAGMKVVAIGDDSNDIVSFGDDDWPKIKATVDQVLKETDDNGE